MHQDNSFNIIQLPFIWELQLYNWLKKTNLMLFNYSQVTPHFADVQPINQSTTTSRRPAPVAPSAPPQAPSLAQAAGRVMRLGLAANAKAKSGGTKTHISWKGVCNLKMELFGWILGIYDIYNDIRILMYDIYVCTWHYGWKFERSVVCKDCRNLSFEGYIVSENKVTILDLSGWFQETQMNNPDSKNKTTLCMNHCLAHTHRSYRYIVWIKYIYIYM